VVGWTFFVDIKVLLSIRFLPGMVWQNMGQGMALSIQRGWTPV
jgi:hypothetical protein